MGRFSEDLGKGINDIISDVKNKLPECWEFVYNIGEFNEEDNPNIESAFAILSVYPENLVKKLDTNDNAFLNRVYNLVNKRLSNVFWDLYRQDGLEIELMNRKSEEIPSSYFLTDSKLYSKLIKEIVEHELYGFFDKIYEKLDANSESSSRGDIDFIANSLDEAKRIDDFLVKYDLKFLFK